VAADPRFDLRTTGDPLGSRLVVGPATPGLAGLTATDHLVSRAGGDARQVGHLTAHGLPDVTPFTDGQPRHPSRLYALPGADLTVLVSEVFVPLPAAEPLADALSGFAAEAGIAEVTVLHGVPYPHGPSEHETYHVATDDHRARGPNGSVPPLPGGFLDGVPGELLARGLDDGPPTGALVTPAHLPGPDFDAALRLLGAVGDLYGVDYDAEALQRRSEETRQQYEQLAERMRALADDESTEYGEDRMYG
jgi:uncharacterized protein